MFQKKKINLIFLFQFRSNFPYCDLWSRGFYLSDGLLECAAFIVLHVCSIDSECSQEERKTIKSFWGQWCPSGEKSHTTTQMQIFGLHLHCQAFFSGKKQRKEKFNSFYANAKKISMNAFQDFFWEGEGKDIKQFF